MLHATLLKFGEIIYRIATTQDMSTVILLSDTVFSFPVHTSMG